MVLRRDLAVIVASIAGALLWIEHGHRIDIETPTGGAFAEFVGTVCPDNENVPYGTDCISFMQGAATEVRWRVTAAKRMPTELSDASSPACPSSNENVPYGANCLRFLSGWFWQPN